MSLLFNDAVCIAGTILDDDDAAQTLTHFQLTQLLGESVLTQVQSDEVELQMQGY